MKELKKPVSPAYCYYNYIAERIADRINFLLKKHEPGWWIHSVGSVQFDQTPKGKFRSTKKTIEVVDSNKKRYRIIVEEV
jgi:hypothetical protein